MSAVRSSSPIRYQAINIRASRRQRDLIDRAAQVLGKSRSGFMLETASREAEDVLLDRTFFTLEREAFERLTALLDNLPPPNDELRELLLTKAPWEWPRAAPPSRHRRR